MDKLRALQYFAAAAEDRSMSAAARRLGVSTPAIAKLLTALERSLGTILFDRTVRGLALTADGESYLEACQPALAQLAAADEGIAGSATRHRGTVVVGTQPYLGQHCILPALSRFHARYPDIQVEIRVVHRLTEELASAVDVFVLAGWQEDVDLVRRHLAQNRFVVCASPAYWAAHGIPRRPSDLERHVCVLWRSLRRHGPRSLEVRAEGRGGIGEDHGLARDRPPRHHARRRARRRWRCASRRSHQPGAAAQRASGARTARLGGDGSAAA